jgi:pantothenate kinase-related protein Tda10
VDSDFLSARAADETSDRLLQFFDGRPPTWRLAMSASVPSRGAVEHLKARFRGLDGSNKPTIVNLLGPGGEGKSTVFLQALAGLIRQDGWVALWRHNDLEKIDWKQIRRVAHRYDKLLVDRIKRFDPSR